MISAQHEKILATTVIGSLSTLRVKDGRISTNPVSFLWNGTEFEISTLKGRVKYRNLAANPQATLCVISGEDPMHYVEVRGSVRLVDDPDRGLFKAHFRRVSGGVEAPEGMDPEGSERAMIFLMPEQVSSPVMYSGTFDNFEENHGK
jgi:PPOX class probable F420-dependent enzyme